MGILNDGKEPYSVDYTACALGMTSKQSKLCDDGRNDFLWFAWFMIMASMVNLYEAVNFQPIRIVLGINGFQTQHQNKAVYLMVNQLSEIHGLGLLVFQKQEAQVQS